MSPRSRTLLCLVACLLVGCTAVGSVTPPATGGKGGVRRAAPKAREASGAAGDAEAQQSALVGRIRLPATILLNNGGRVVARSGGGSLVSDQGGAVLSNNGATLISDQGGAVVSNNGGGLLGETKPYALRQALGTGPGGDVVAIANAQVGLFDARGEAVRDASGAPLVTTTDAEGRYAFPAAPTDRAVVAVCQLAGTAGQAAALVPKARGQADLDVASSVMASYVISKFARPQADPQAALDRLSAGLEVRALAATAAALAKDAGPAQLAAAAAVATVESLRATRAAVDAAYEAVRRAMVIAGQANLGEGQPARTAQINLEGARRTQAGDWWLIDSAAARVWQVANGRLQILAGAGGEGNVAPGDGDRAREVSLGSLWSVREGPDGRPWFLQTSYSAQASTDGLFRLEPDGSLRSLWRRSRPHDESIHVPDPIDFLPLSAGQALIIDRRGIVPVGGAPDHPLELQGDVIVAADRRPGGRIRLLVESLSEADPSMVAKWRVLEARPGVPAVVLPVPDAGRCYGFDDAGNMITVDASAELAFHPPDGGSPLRLGAAITQAWPPELRPLPATSGFYRSLKFGGDVRTTGWVHGWNRLATFGPDGKLTPVIEGPDASPVVDQGPTALVSPSLAAMDAAGLLYVVDRGALLRVVDRRAEPVAGRGFWPNSELRPSVGDPFAYTLALRDENGLDGGEVQGFGSGYGGPAREARFPAPMALRVAPDGSVWLLDGGAFVRRVAGERLETMAVRSSRDASSWIEMIPVSADAAVVLALAGDHVKLLQVSGTQSPVELVRLAREETYGGLWKEVLGLGLEAWLHTIREGDDVIGLPGGAWLLRVQGVLWRWAPGTAPVRLGSVPGELPSQTDEADGMELDSSQRGAMMAASAEGKVAVADERRVYRLDTATGKATPVAGAGTANLAGATPDTGLMSVVGLAVAPNGDLLIVDEQARQVKRVPAAAW